MKEPRPRRVGDLHLCIGCRFFDSNLQTNSALIVASVCACRRDDCDNWGAGDIDRLADAELSAFLSKPPGAGIDQTAGEDCS